MPTERTRGDEVERIVGLGATMYQDPPQGRRARLVTLLDPEGNEFCVERSSGERGI